MKNEFLMNLKLKIKLLSIIQHRSGANNTHMNGIFLRELIEFKFNTKLNVKDMIFKKQTCFKYMAISLSNQSIKSIQRLT